MDEWAGLTRVPGWSEHRWLRAGFSTRLGGVSSAYGDGELNLGWTAADEASNTTENRRRFVAGVAGDGTRFELVTVRQTHSTDVQFVGRDHGPLTTAEGKAVLPGDGLVTDVPGVMIGVQTADCVPVLVADIRQRVVGAFHAGWRGTAAKIVERGVAEMKSEVGSKPRDLIAALGPSIGGCCYEVGDDVRSAFVKQFAYGEELFSDGKQLDLWEANRRQLLHAGVAADRITVLGECSACMRTEAGGRKYFSHRAEQGSTGRMIAAIGVVS